MKARVIFAWYDFWVGLFWDSAKRRLYVFPVPMLGVVFDFKVDRPATRDLDEPATHPSCRRSVGDPFFDTVAAGRDPYETKGK